MDRVSHRLFMFKTKINIKGSTETNLLSKVKLPLNAERNIHSFVTLLKGQIENVLKIPQLSE